MKLAADMVGVGARPPQGRSSRLVVGVPQLLAWRLLIVIGAKALLEEELDLARLVLREPLEVEELGGRFSHRSLLDRRDLFYSAAFLGNADHAAQYLNGLWSRSPHFEAFFSSDQEFRTQMSQFLMIVALADAAKDDGERPLYPTYRRISDAFRGMSVLCGRIFTRSEYQDFIGRSVWDVDGSVVRGLWESVATRANSVGRDSQHMIEHGPFFPEQWNGQVGGW